MMRADIIADLTQFSENWSPVDFMLAAKHADLFLLGLRNTTILLVGPLCLACLTAIPLAWARASRTPIASPLIFAYTYLFRGTPLASNDSCAVCLPLMPNLGRLSTHRRCT